MSVTYDDAGEIYDSSEITYDGSVTSPDSAFGVFLPLSELKPPVIRLTSAKGRGRSHTRLRIFVTVDARSQGHTRTERHCQVHMRGRGVRHSGTRGHVTVGMTREVEKRHTELSKAWVLARQREDDAFLVGLIAGG